MITNVTLKNSCFQYDGGVNGARRLVCRKLFEGDMAVGGQSAQLRRIVSVPNLMYGL